MILGLSAEAFTRLHVTISLLAIVAGFVVLALMIAGRIARVVTMLYLAASLLTDLTGFLFYKRGLGPVYVVGALSLIVLLLACFALYSAKLAGAWRGTWVVCAVIGLYLNVFVAVAQAFGKLPALHALAPNGSEPPFAIAQGVTLLVFVALGWLALRRFRAPPTPARA